MTKFVITQAANSLQKMAQQLLWHTRQSVKLLTLCWLLSSCTPPLDAASELRAVLDTMIAAVGRKDSHLLMEFLTADFLANQNLGKPQMAGLVSRYFQHNPVITVTLMDTEITVQDATARSHFKLMLTGGAQVLPERLRWLEVELEWVRVEAQWKIRAATWHDVGGPLRE